MRTCPQPECGRPVVARGLCDGHYRQFKRGDPLAPIPRAVRYAPTCTFDGCDGKHFSAGLCAGHWQQRNKGRELAPIIRGRSQADRFWEKVEKSQTCWMWRGAVGSAGYGNVQYEGRTWRAHRLAYALILGELPDQMPDGSRAVLDHLCRTTLCVNPAHLEPVSDRTNIIRGVGPALAKIQNVDQTFCKHGHPLFGKNLYVQPKTGYRYCRTCQRRRRAEWAARR